MTATDETGPDERDGTRRAVQRATGRSPEAYVAPAHPLGGTLHEPGVRLPTSHAPWTRDDELADLTDEAFRLRVDLERSLLRGGGREDHPVLVGHRRAVRDLATGWGHVPVDDGASSAPAEASALLPAARALAEVAEEADADGRLAVLARAASVRDELGWADAGALGRDVVDQYALAVAHAEVVRACAGRVRARARRGLVGPAPASPGTDALADLGAALGVPLPADRPRDEGRSERAWDRRLRRAEAGLRTAARLVRHARKAGWLPSEAPSAADRGPADDRRDDAADPLRPLAAPLPVVRHEPTEAEVRVLESKLAMLASWPPPDLVLWDDLVSGEAPWSLFDYLPGFDSEGRHCEDGEWALRVVDPDVIWGDLADLDLTDRERRGADEGGDGPAGPPGSGPSARPSRRRPR